MPSGRLVVQMDRKRPLVYSTLQLGRSWDDVICSLLGDVEVKTVTSSLPQFGQLVVATA